MDRFFSLPEEDYEIDGTVIPLAVLTEFASLINPNKL